jgi:hypothetical protein
MLDLITKKTLAHWILGGNAALFPLPLGPLQARHHSPLVTSGAGARTSGNTVPFTLRGRTG